MKSPYRALIWEQARTAGVLCGALCLLSLLSTLTVHLQNYLEQVFNPWDIEGRLYLVSLMGVFAFTFRRDSAGHLRWGFDTRLFRLPVSFTALLTLVLGTRLFLLLFLLAFNALAIVSLDAGLLLWAGADVLTLLCFYFLLQAAGCSYRRAPFVTYAAVAVFALAIVLPSIFLESSYEADKFVFDTLYHPATLLFIMGISVLVMVLGVNLERHDKHFGPPSLPEIIRSTLHSLSLPLGKFETSFEAQFAYELRRVGWKLSLITVVATGVAIPFFRHDTDLLNWAVIHYAPLVALPLAALFTGVSSLYPRSRFSSQLPIASSTIAGARLLAHFRALLRAMGIAGVLSFLLLIQGPMMRLLAAGYQDEGFIVSFDFFVAFMRPLVLAGMFAWIALWIVTPPMRFISAVCLAYIVISRYLLRAKVINLEEPYVFWAYGIVVIALVLSSITFLYAYRQQIFSARQVLGQFVLWLALFLVLWQGSRSPQGGVGALLSGTAALCLLLPVTSLAWSIHKRRHDVVTRRIFL